MLNKLRISTYFIVGIVLGLTLAIGHSVYALKDDQDIPFEELQAFSERQQVSTHEKDKRHVGPGNAHHGHSA